jgi:hypothetical protein
MTTHAIRLEDTLTITDSITVERHPAASSGMSIAVGIRSNGVVHPQKVIRLDPSTLRWLLSPEGGRLAAWLAVGLALLMYLDR